MKKNFLFIAIIALAILAIYFIGQTVVLKKELKATEQCLVETEQKLTVSEIKLNETHEELINTKFTLDNITIDHDILKECYFENIDSLQKELKKTKKPIIFETDPNIIDDAVSWVLIILERYDVPESAAEEIVETLFDFSDSNISDRAFDDRYWK